MVQKPLTGIDWKRYPKELGPSTADKKANKRNKALKVKIPSKRAKVANTEELLNKLENAEKNEKEVESESESENEDDDKKSDKNEEMDEDEPDEEMDDGTDYANNYFDNGEGYLDEEDDNLDEGDFIKRNMKYIFDYCQPSFHFLDHFKVQIRN